MNVGMKGHIAFEIHETTLGEDRCIITWSRVRADRDRKAREEVLGKISLTLSSPKPLSKKFITNRSYKKYLIVKGETQCTLNHKAITEDAKKDGFFGIITNCKGNACNSISFRTTKNCGGPKMLLGK